MVRSRRYTFDQCDSLFRGLWRSRILYLDHVEGDGRLLFGQIVAMDLEGIVCKRKDSLQGDGEALALLDQG
jgi:hypothetical protein